jgi:hypothetical protein
MRLVIQAQCYTGTLSYIHIHPIMIGVTGTIYKEFYDTMDLLGVSKAEAKRCAAVMHNIAVSYVDIITTKWQQERQGVG